MSGQSERSDDCLFCKIASGEIPTTFVAESDRAVAFADLSPVAPIHLLIVPREHIADASTIRDVDGPLLAEMLGIAQRLAEKDPRASDGYRLVFNVGDDAGNSVAHLHLHLIGGRSMSWPPG